MDEPVAGREYLFSCFVLPTQERIAAKLSYLHRKSSYSHRDASRLQCANISEFSTAVSYGMDPLILIISCLRSRGERGVEASIMSLCYVWYVPSEIPDSESDIAATANRRKWRRRRDSNVEERTRRRSRKTQARDEEILSTEQRVRNPWRQHNIPERDFQAFSTLKSVLTAKVAGGSTTWRSLLGDIKKAI
ncbi:unnamed protein product [Nesidiocoris tenuis]|nr:unnamed protein product [Nesidiocoris tenuis]